jgi:hypothetical protein
MSQHIDAESNATTSGKAEVKVSFHPNSWHIWCLGITIVIGGQYFSWNFGLVAGFGSCCISYCIVSCAYLALCCCTSELTSALPFAGGAYGLARCSLGFYCGFMVGCSEALEYITYTAISYVTLVSMLVSAAPGLAGWEPLLWLLLYVVSLIIYILCKPTNYSTIPNTNRNIICQALHKLVTFILWVNTYNKHFIIYCHYSYNVKRKGQTDMKRKAQTVVKKKAVKTTLYKCISTINNLWDSSGHMLMPPG